MDTGVLFTGRLIAAAGGLDFKTKHQPDAAGSSCVRPKDEVETICPGLDQFGVIIIEKTGGMGAGARL